MTDEWADLRAKAEAATPGPWQHGPLYWEVWSLDEQRAMRTRVAVIIEEERQPDAAYIAAASPDVIRRLLDERDRLAEELRLRRSTGQYNADVPWGTGGNR